MKKLVCLIAITGMSSFALAQQSTMPHKMDPEERKAVMQKRQDNKMAQMQRELNLTPTQQAQLKALREKYRPTHEKGQVKPEQAKISMEERRMRKQQMQDEMKKILTPEQYAKWEAKKRVMRHKGMQKDHNRK